VPIDDESTCVYNVMYGYDENSGISAEYAEGFESFSGRGKDDFIPGTWRLKKNLANDYLVDREVQKTKTYTGIKGLNTQDFALQEGMGPRVDRTKENLGTTDRAIVTMRRLMLEAITAVEDGGSPRGADPLMHRSVRPYEGLMPATANWHDDFAAELVAKW
jgi:phthalate 4,5-dioxygenase